MMNKLLLFLRNKLFKTVKDLARKLVRNLNKWHCSYCAITITIQVGEHGGLVAQNVKNPPALQREMELREEGLDLTKQWGSEIFEACMMINTTTLSR